MDLNEAQIWILSQLESGKVPELSDFNGLLDEENPLDQKRELAYYIQQLEKNGLIRIGDKAFIFDHHPFCIQTTKKAQHSAAVLLAY